MKQAFTLIELLVVISIIASLLAVGVPNFIGIRQRGRDSKRKVDLKEIQSALELYKLNQTFPSYPPTATWKTDLQTGQYMNSVPEDPLSTAANPKDYYYKKNETSDIKYDLYACLENEDDNDPNVTSTGCPADYCASNVCYHLTEP